MDQELKEKRMAVIERQTEYNVAKKMNELKQKKIRNRRISFALSGLILIAALNSCEPKKKDVIQPTTTIQTTTDNFKEIDEAQMEVIVEYANDSYAKCISYLSDASEAVSQEEIDEFGNMYFKPLMEAYTTYLETNEIDQKEAYYNDFIYKAKLYDKKISEINESFSFDNSKYRDAKYIDGHICVPYSGELPEEYYIDPSDGESMYVPFPNSEGQKMSR